MSEFAPIPRDGESVRWSHWGDWFWKCRCGFEASCREDVGGHRRACAEARAAASKDGAS